MIDNLFEMISEQMLMDFDISAQINHHGIKGSLREDALYNFLANGRLPSKYGVSSGIVVTTLSTDQSRELDLVIYDKNLCPTWISSRSYQVFPIEGVYGCIEVKSKLSKQELENSLKKIKSLRNLVPQRCPMPFGMIFAYSLDGNSLDSLEKNLLDFQKDHSFVEWPNLVVVLNEGIIFQKQGTTTIFEVEKFNKKTFPISIHFKKRSLFHFYSFLFDILNTIQLSPILISRYSNQPSRMNDLIIRHYDYTSPDNPEDYLFIKEVFDFCKNHDKIKFSQIHDMPFLGDPLEVNLDQEVYLYDPEHLPSDSESILRLMSHNNTNDSRYKCRYPLGVVEINYNVYYFPVFYIMKFRKTFNPD